MKIGLTTGDLNGVGLEVLMKTFSDKRIFDFCTPVLYGSSKILSFHRKALQMDQFNFSTVHNASQASPQKMNIINCWQEDVIVDLGKPTDLSGRYALKSIEASVEDLKNNRIDALVTAPVHKHNIPLENFTGHTEYIAGKVGASGFLMTFSGEDLRIAVATGHVPVAKLATILTTDLIHNKIKLFHQTLARDFAIRKPKIAVMGLNPHAGENGIIGTEDRDIIVPAINMAKESNMLVFGPYGADGFFGSLAYKKFDGILAIYHDQGLTPFKLLAFDTGVNFTAGLPVIRTSPDHGTAYDIAGKGIASENSFREAVLLACRIHKNRQRHNEITSNPLKSSVLEKESIG